MEEIQIFSNPNFGQIRTITIDGAPYFAAKEVAEALGYIKTRNAIAQHVDQEDALKWGVLDERGVIQNTTLINESGVYSLIMRSTLPMAKTFKRWVTSDVLPTIRKTGIYNLNDSIAKLESSVREITETLELETKRLEKSEQGREALLHFLNQKITNEKQQQEVIAKQQDEISHLTTLLNEQALSKRIFTVTEIANELNMSARDLNMALKEEGIQYFDGEKWVIQPCCRDKGYVKTHYYTQIKRNNGRGTQVPYMVWTAKGRDFILDTFDQ